MLLLYTSMYNTPVIEDISEAYPWKVGTLECLYIETYGECDLYVKMLQSSASSLLVRAFTAGKLDLRGYDVLAAPSKNCGANKAVHSVVEDESHTYFITNKNGVVSGKLLDSNDNVLSRCVVTVDDEVLRISSWYSTSLRSGYGKKILTSVIKYAAEHGLPPSVQYTWNGENEYVHDWMVKHFDAKCTCPLVIQKKECAADDPRCRVFDLDREKFKSYFGLEDK